MVLPTILVNDKKRSVNNKSTFHRGFCHTIQFPAEFLAILKSYYRILIFNSCDNYGDIYRVNGGA